MNFIRVFLKENMDLSDICIVECFGYFSRVVVFFFSINVSEWF